MKKYHSACCHPSLSFFLRCFFLIFVQALASDGVQAQLPVSRSPLLFVENLDKFPSNDRFVFSKVQVPWSGDDINYNSNHDTLIVRIRNKGLNNLEIKNLILSNDSSWKLVKLGGVNYVSNTSLPLTISAGTYTDLMVAFVAVDAATRVKVFHDSLTIVSNDVNFPSKTVFLSGLWQKQGEGLNEPYAREIIDAFGFKTNTGFAPTDPDEGDRTKPKGDEIIPSYFVRVDTARPVSVRQMSAYHNCCTQVERIEWFLKDSATFRTLFTHSPKDGQSLLPRKNFSNSPAQGSFNPKSAFGFRVGYRDNSDARKNPGGKIGIRVWKAIDEKGNIIPYSYIISNDYLGSMFTNYDYNDNMYFVSNIRPEAGPAFFSALKSAPSDLDFGEKILQSSSSLQLNLSSLGKIYPDSSSDPVIKISSIKITGENSSEFSASMPSEKNLEPQDSTTVTVNFRPATQGLKIADLLIYYNSSLSPLRVPLYGIARSPDTTVVVNYRINSGSANPITTNGKTWEADIPYAFDNIEPYTNPRLKEIAGTDDDALYLKEQSSNADKKPFRYEIPVKNGEYAVRLHFAEIYWAAPGSGINGGEGSRIMNIYLENQLRLANFDVTQEVGGATALVKNFSVMVTDGKLDINFTASVNRPMVVAVEVISFHASTTLSSAGPVVNVLPEENRLKKVKVFPNPAQKRFKIVFPSGYSGSSALQITDALGRVYQLGKIKLERGRSNTAEVDILNLSLKPGFYYLRIVSETRPVEVIKLVIK